VLDAGCGTGRVGAELHARGHRVVGVDADPVLVAAAQEDHPGPTWVVADLTEVDPAAYGGAGSFDAAVAAGNVLVYAAPGSVSEVVAAVAAHLRPGGVLVTGFSTGEHYAPADLDHDAASVGLALEQRFATWDLRPWHEGADWVVSLHRRPDGHVDAGANV
jgi:predicted TPR repeat methyltransferase